MDFLLECIGFPPDSDLDELARLARARGEPVAWRGPRGEHLRFALAPGLDLRLDREEGSSIVSLYPHCQSEHRLRVAVSDVRALPDSPFDAHLIGRANPPARQAPVAEVGEEGYDLTCVLTDARRLPRELERGHVLAVALAGFALDVAGVGREPHLEPPPHCARLRDGGWIGPLGGPDDPGGCVDLSLRVERVEVHANPLSGRAIHKLETRAPGRTLTLFASPWQLELDEIALPRPGDWIAGTFLLSGRVAGGLGGPSSNLRSSFG